MKSLFPFRNLTRRAVAGARSLAANRGGNVMVTFAIGAFAIFGIVGGAIDFSRVETSRKHVQDAADAALLRTMSMPSTATDVQRQTAADQAFNENFSDKSVYGITRTLKKEVTGNTISQSYNVSANVTSYFAALFGMDHYGVSVVAKAQSTMQKSEIAIVLDSTGSMSLNNKMTNLKASVDSVLANMLDSSGKNVSGTKVAIVPFSKQVRVTNAVNYDYVDYGTQALGEGCKTSGTFNSTVCSMAWNTYDTICSGVSDVTTCRANNRGWYLVTGPDADGKTWYTIVYKSSVGSTVYKFTEVYYTTSKTVTTAPYYYTDETGTHYNAGGTSTSTTTTFYSGALGTDTSATSTPSGYTAVPSNGLTFTVNNGNGYGASLLTTSTATNKPTTGATSIRTYLYPATADTKASWNGCIMDRTQPYDTQVDSPNPLIPATLYPAKACVDTSLKTVQGLSDDIKTARAFVQTITAGSASATTNISIGVQWGMEVLSPTAPFTGGVAFNDDVTKKYMIVVTDGENTANRWTTTSADIDKRTALACTNAKKLGITIFVVKVIEGNSDMLRACATKPEYFYDLTSASQINTALSAVFEAIKKTRLTQ